MIRKDLRGKMTARIPFAAVLLAAAWLAVACGDKSGRSTEPVLLQPTPDRTVDAVVRGLVTITILATPSVPARLATAAISYQSQPTLGTQPQIAAATAVPPRTPTPVRPTAPIPTVAVFQASAPSTATSSAPTAPVPVIVSTPTTARAVPTPAAPPTPVPSVGVPAPDSRAIPLTAITAPLRVAAPPQP